MKICGGKYGCGKTKDESEFYYNEKNDSYNTYCKPCHKKFMKEYNRKNKKLQKAIKYQSRMKGLERTNFKTRQEFLGEGEDNSKLIAKLEENKRKKKEDFKKAKDWYREDIVKMAEEREGKKIKKRRTKKRFGKKISATKIRKNFGGVLKKIIEYPVIITKNDKDKAIILSIDDYKRLKEQTKDKKEVKQKKQKIVEGTSFNLNEVLKSKNFIIERLEKDGTKTIIRPIKKSQNIVSDYEIGKDTISFAEEKIIKDEKEKTKLSESLQQFFYRFLIKFNSNLKKCSKCGKIRKKSRFPISYGVNKNYLKSYCKDCENKRKRENAKRNAIKNLKNPPPKEKKCYTCGKIKKREEFYIKNDKKLGLSASCKECLKKRGK